MAQKPEVGRYIRELERRETQAGAGEAEQPGDLPNASELIREVEQFLRERPRPDEGTA